MRSAAFNIFRRSVFEKGKKSVANGSQFLGARILQPSAHSMPCLNFYSSQEKPMQLVNLNSDVPKQSTKKEESVFDISKNEDLSHIAPHLEPSLTFSSYINKSPFLQQLLKLGVDLSVLERKEGVAQFFLGLDFEKDVKPHLFFLSDIGVRAEGFGKFITKNPFIFKESLEDLKVRINYLESKKFNKDMISRIVTANPHWLMFPVERIDGRLGYFQKTYHLNGDQVRQLACDSPKLITYKLAKVRLVTFVVKEEMGFTDPEVKSLLLRKPKLFRLSQSSLLSRFEYVHNIMKIQHQELLDQPTILLSRAFKIKQRHLFLESLGRAQYNPNLPGYIRLDDIANGIDSEFCENVAKSSIQTFNLFLKSQGL